MDNKLKDQVIYPKDLLFAALYRWRAAIVVGLVLAILLGGFQLRGASPTVLDDGAMVAYNTALAEYEAKKAALQNYLDDFQNELRTEEAYLTESVYLNLDPYSHYRGTLQVYVHTNYQIQPDKAYQTPDIAEPLLSSYITLMHSDSTIQALADLAGFTWRQTAELYTLTYDADLNALTATISGNDQETVKLMLDEIWKLMGNAKTALTDTIGSHDLRMVYKSVDMVADTEINVVLRNTWNHLNFLKEQITIIQTEQANLTAPAAPAVGGGSVKKAAIFAVLGFVAGVGIVAVCAWFGHMESSKVYSARLLSLRTGIKVLGTLTVTKFNPIDNAIRKWEGRDMDKPQGKAALLACDLRNRFPSGKLLLTGSGKAEDRVCLLNALKDAGVDAEDAGDILKDSQAVAALQKADAVVLAVLCGNATCQDVLYQVQAVEDYEKQLLGCVVLNG